MKKIIIAIFVLLLSFSFYVQAAEKADGKAQDSKSGDSTGTNPVAFTHDFRTYMELASLPDGDNSSSTLTVERRFPIGEDWQFRFRARHSSLSIDPNEDGAPDLEVSGMGDFDMRVLNVPYLTKERAIAVGLEVFLDTASNQTLGAGKNALGPQIFGVFFRPFGSAALFAPAYQYKFDVSGDDDRDDISQSLIDLFFLWMDPNKKWWVLADPQIVIDHEQEEEFTLVDVEYGQMIMGGFSTYIRPSAGIGDDKPYDWSLELGFKAIWR